MDTYHVQPTKVQYYSPLVLALVKNTKTMFLLRYCILIVLFLFTVILFYLLLFFKTFPYYKTYLPCLFTIFISSLYLMLIYLIYFTYRFSIFMFFLITLHQVHLAFCLFVSTKLLPLFMNRFLGHHCFTAISFDKRSYYLLLPESTSFPLLLGHQCRALYS